MQIVSWILDPDTAKSDAFTLFVQFCIYMFFPFRLIENKLKTDTVRQSKNIHFRFTILENTVDFLRFSRSCFKVLSCNHITKNIAVPDIGEN